MIRTVIAVAALALAPGTAAQTAEMTFYQLPAGAYPHDVAPAPDGTVSTRDLPAASIPRADSSRKFRSGPVPRRTA